MDASVSAAEAPVESEDYYLDLGADASVNVEDFDFKLDGVYGDDGQPHEEAANGEDSANMANNFEISYEEEDGRPNATEGPHMDGDTVKDDVDENIRMEYQDEIGYEEEGPSAAGDDSNQETAVPDISDGGNSVDFAENPEVYEQAEELEAHPSVMAHDYTVFEDDSGEQLSHAELDDSEEVAGSLDRKNRVADESNDASTHHSPQDQENTFALRSENSQDTATENSPFAPIPDLTVSYNNGQYSLVGDPEDDPDSYFLSNEKDLDEPLSDFLASIRSVISDEVSSEDELMIRINALGLEFGERSNQKFLARTFRDILSCFAALVSDPSKDASQSPSSLQMELLVRRDSEARYLELLEEIGQQSSFPNDPEDPESASVSNAAYVEGDEELEEAQGNEYDEQFQLNEEDATVSASEVQASGEDEVYVEYEATEFETVAVQDGNDAIGDAFETQGHLSGPGSASLTQLDSTGINNFEGEDDDSMEFNEDYDDEQWEGIQGGEQAGIGKGLAANNTDATAVPESGANDVDTSVAFDSVNHLPADEPASGSDGAVAAIDEADTNYNVGHPVNALGQIDFDTAETIDSKSKHTSRTSTIIGDETGHAQYLEGDLSVANGHQSQGETVENDEIDWENEGDEPEHTTTTQSSMSAFGKRGRVNDRESLADEADHKRRRT